MDRGSRDRHGRGVRRPLDSALLAPGSSRGLDAEEVVSRLMLRLRANHPELLSGVSWEVRDIPEDHLLKQPIPEFRADRNERKIVIYRIPIMRASNALLEPRWAIESRVYVALSRLVERSPGFLKRKPKPTEPKL
ncbi:MAG: hypothetical protein RL198_799 [Actinomycetota bacterium]|jgi:hypothetical protein